jgi:hypothetical protein
MSYFNEVTAALWQGLLILLSLIVPLSGIYALVYWFSWGNNPRWLEGSRDRFKLPNLLDNRFWLWIHKDTQYWIVRLRFDKGPVVIEGAKPTARYWSITYYPAKENTSSINSQSVKLDGQDRYRITFGKKVENCLLQQTIKVDSGVTRGIVELRITLLDTNEPLILPSVTQGERVLVREAQM